MFLRPMHSRCLAKFSIDRLHARFGEDFTHQGWPLSPQRGARSKSPKSPRIVRIQPAFSSVVGAAQASTTSQTLGGRTAPGRQRERLADIPWASDAEIPSTEEGLRKYGVSRDRWVGHTHFMYLGLDEDALHIWRGSITPLGRASGQLLESSSSSAALTPPPAPAPRRTASTSRRRRAPQRPWPRD